MTDVLPSSDYDRLRELKRMLDESRSALDPAIQRSDRARRYYDGDQISSAMRSKLKRAKQPETVRNRIAPGVDGILGLIEQSKVDPRAFPRNPQDEEATDVATKCLQYVADKNRFHKLKLDVADNHCVEGIGAAIVQADDNGDVIISQIKFREFFYDPHSKEADYSDAKYMGIAKWMYASDLAALYPELEHEINQTINQSNGIVAGGLSWDDDKPNTSLPWIDRKLRRVMAVEIYYREDVWMRCVFCAAGELEESHPSPYLDEDGQPMNPIEASSCFIDSDLQRYSIVRRAIPLQDELNARASRSLHLFNSRQLVIQDANNPPEVDADTARIEAARADGVIPLGYGPSQTSDMGQGNLMIMQEVSRELDRLFPTPAVLGRMDGSSQSGRSRLVLQQAGMTELGRSLGRLEDWENRIYRQCWLRIRQFWTDQKYIRVTNDEGAPEFLQINEPIYARIPLVNPDGTPAIDESGEPMTQVALVPQPVMGPDGQPQMGPDGQPVMQPQPVIEGYDNRVAEMDMDIQVESMPDTANLAAEQFAEILKLVPIYGPEKVPFEAVLALSSLPEKRKVRDLLEPKDEGAAQMQAMQAQMAQMAAQLGEMKAKADIAETESKTALNLAKTKETEAGIIESAAEMQAKAINAAMNGAGQPDPMAGY